MRAVWAAGIRDGRVLEALRVTPREGFVPARYAGDAYEDGPVPIGHGQVTTQPSSSARMIYDAVIVSAAFPEVPAPLVEQLRVGGRLVQPIGPGGREDVVLFERTAAGLARRRVLTPAYFVRLYGRYGFPPDDEHP